MASYQHRDADDRAELKPPSSVDSNDALNNILVSDVIQLAVGSYQDEAKR
jgi:hypothetical protein